MNESKNSERYDAIFLGGGLSSSLMARYLKLQHPDFKILILEKNTTTHYNPGESTVGVASLFLIRDLGLSTYCYLNHLPKCGLRYFFHDRENGDGKPFDVTTCSEIGPNILPIIPTFQVDRKRLDRDLWDLNREIGIEMVTGALVTDVSIGQGDVPNRVEWKHEGKALTSETRWVINSLGRMRGSKVAELFDRLSPASDDTEHLTAGAWGRFSGTKDIDLLGDEAWRKKVGFTSRYLSTNHFMGRGFWIWEIPIGEETISWGIVYDKTIIKDLTEAETFLEFLNEQPFVKELLEKSEMLDFQSHPHLTFKREKFCSTDGWAIVGDAHGFLDPFYSPGSDVLARQAFLLDHLVPPQDPQELEEAVQLVNDYTWFEYDLVKILYQDQYNGFGSYELFNIKSLWDFHSYTNRLVWFFLDKKYADVEFIKRELKNREKTIQLTRAVQTGFTALATHLTATGRYERHNLGQYSLRQNRFRMEEDMLVSYDDESSISSHFGLCKLTVSELIECRFDIVGFQSHRMAQHALSASTLMAFELTEDWFDSFCDKVANDMKRQLRTQFGDNGFSVTVDAECFSLPRPKGLENAQSDVQNYAAQLWQEVTINPVAAVLLNGPTD